jgi:hypothetical protein
MTVEAELKQAVAEVERKQGPQGSIYEHLKQAQSLMEDLSPDALERLDEAVAIHVSLRELYDAGEEWPLPSRLLELFATLSPLERGSILRISTIVFALRKVRAADPSTLEE